MQGLNAAEVLELFERGHALGPVARGRLLLGRAWPEAGEAVRGLLPVGERDRLILGLRAQTFGARAPLLATCAECGAELEAELDLGELLATPAVDDPFEPRTLVHEGREVRYRLPGSTDLEAALTSPNPAAALLQRCLEPSEAEGEATPPEALSSQDLALALEAAISEHDPLAEIRLDLVCAECGHTHAELFDAVAYFWAEIEARARRLLGEIHLLASAYGWSEAQILALGPVRRQLYLGMVSP